ncbi:MAG: Asp-tRNA(Asn)/Glu-tRNA(Gln) amidotransferase GatCAB subunit A, partial [Microcella sp.]|nr:Asp-tRNA(Asn)/Glu-tRNA(Gln) amidotransferase GatCAB subunit A [Microcella sp.]
VPGMGLPMGLAPEDGLPVGLQLMAPAREDARLYDVGAGIEALLEQRWGGPLWAQAPALG